MTDDRWKNFNIYDITQDFEDNEGNLQSFTFKPLPWKDFPKAYNLVSKMGAVAKSGDEAEFIKRMDEEYMDEAIRICKLMVLNSYPEADESSIEGFVMGNVTELVDVLFRLITRQKKNKRKAEQALKND